MEDNRFDLTEDRQFTKSKNQESPQPLICWLGTSSNVEMLREIAKENHEYERLIAPKKKSNCKLNEETSHRIDINGNNYIYYSMSPTGTSTTYSTSTSSTINYSFINRTTDNTIVDYSDSMRMRVSYSKNHGYNQTITYTIKNPKATYDPLSEYERKMRKHREELFGSPTKPTIESPMGSEMKNECMLDGYGDMKFPWDNASIEKYLVYESPRRSMFPWISGHLDDFLLDMEDDYPWDIEPAVTDDNYIIPLKSEYNTSSSFTRRIHDIMPWMVDMIRDVWRTSITRELLEEYFSDHWHEMENPVYREKWFSGVEKKEDTPEPTWFTSSVNRVYLTGETNDIVWSLA